MSTATPNASARQRALSGLAFVGVIAILLGLTIARFQQRFTDSVDVVLRADRAGTQLNQNADVKLRGIVVGRVAERRSTGRGAELTLALQPDHVRLIPKTVSARILPKTLLGEKFVDLVAPSGGPGTEHIEDGDVIPLDRSASALEVERVLADLFPLLRSLQPEKLNRALTGIADGLRGRGDALGANLAALDRYLAGIEPELPTIQRDLSGLADLAASLDVNAADLVRLARDATVTSRTVTSQQDVLARFLRGTAGFADTTRAVLERNERNVIRLADLSRDVLEVIDARRGQLPGTVKGLRHLLDELNLALGSKTGTPALAIRLELVPNRGAYTAADRPSYGASTDTRLVDAAAAAAEWQALRSVLAPVLDLTPESVPEVVSVLFGPMLRGQLVALR